MHLLNGVSKTVLLLYLVLSMLNDSNVLLHLPLYEMEYEIFAA